MKAASGLLSVLFCIALAVVFFALSPLHPKNITDGTVAEKGTEFTVKLTGISEFDESGFRVVTDGFNFKDKKAFLCTDSEGYARTDYDGNGEVYILGKYNSTEVLYENYNFCGEEYRNRTELEEFFNITDPIYNFDINKLSEYVSDVINYEKRFYGRATVKIYRGRCVITGIYIGDEKVLELRER